MGDFWDRTLADAFARGSLFSALAVHLWRGHMLWHHGQLREALHSVRTSNEQSELWGAPAVGVPYGQAFIVGILLEQGELAEARRVRRRRAAPGADRRRRPAVRREPRPAADAPRAATTRRWPARGGDRPCRRSVVNPVWRPWRTYRAPVLAALGRVDEARALMAEEVRAGPALGRPVSVLGRTLRVRRRARRPGVAAMLREAYSCCGRRWPATSWPAPSWRWPG